MCKTAPPMVSICSREKLLSSMTDLVNLDEINNNHDRSGVVHKCGCGMIDPDASV